MAEAAERYGVHPATIRRWISRGLVAAYQVGQRRLGIKESDLANVVKPRAAGQEPGTDRAQKAFRGGEIIYDLAPPAPLTKEEQEQARQLIKRIDRRREELAAQYGKMTPESWVLINEARDIRSRQLMGEDVEE